MKIASLLALTALLAATTTVASSVMAHSGATQEPAAKGASTVADDGKPTSSVMGDSALDIGTTYCTSVRNSVGEIANLTVYGSAIAADNSVALHVTGLPQNSFGVFITSRYPGFLPAPLGSSGNICMRRDIGRFAGPGQVMRTGLLRTLTLDTTLNEWSTDSIPRTIGAYPAMVGTRTHFQLWYRDNIQGTPTSNFSDAEFVDWL